MNKGYIIILTLLVFWAGIFTACNDKYENYATGPDNILVFSRDTVSFDTLFSTIGSATMKFRVYNPNNKPVRVSSIYLAGAGQSSFRINVDGFRGNSFSDVEIRSQDSIYIFVETTLDENTTNQPVLMEDSIMFLTNNVKQKVVLQAYGQDAYIWKNGTIIETDSLLKNDKPYLIYDSLVVREGVMLTIAKGTSFYMHDKARINIYGTLKIEGTLQDPVTIRGDRSDYTVGINYDKLPGQWSGIYFGPDSYSNTIDHAHIRNGQYGLICRQSDPVQSKLRIRNSVLSNVYYELFSAENCNIVATNCEFSNAGGPLVSINGGKYSFVHCTLANYFVWDSRYSSSLLLKNYKKEQETTTPLPLLQADFLNCIIYGTHTNEIAFNQVKESDAPGTDFKYKIDYCLIKLSKDSVNIRPDISHFIINENPKFKTIDNDNFVWNFQLSEGSPAIDTGHIPYATLVPLDMNGISRFSDSGPDRGAYEWTPDE